MWARVGAHTLAGIFGFFVLFTCFCYFMLGGSGDLWFGWLAGCLASWLVGLLTGWLARRLASWLYGLSGWLGCWLAAWSSA